MNLGTVDLLPVLAEMHAIDRLPKQLVPEPLDSARALTPRATVQTRPPRMFADPRPRKIPQRGESLEGNDLLVTTYSPQIAPVFEQLIALV